MSFFLNNSKKLSSQLKIELSKHKDKTGVSVIFDNNGIPVFYWFKDSVCFSKSINEQEWSEQQLINNLSWIELNQIRSNLKFISKSVDDWFVEEKKSCFLKIRNKVHNVIWKKNNSQFLES